MRPFWPYVKDARSVSRIRKELPIPVAACWNGAAVFKAALYRYRPTRSTGSQGELPEDLHRTLAKRGWKMVDNSKMAGL